MSSIPNSPALVPVTVPEVDSRTRSLQLVQWQLAHERGDVPGVLARVSQMLDHFTQYVGSAPDASPAVLCGIAHMQTSEGVWYPRGGTGAVPRALARLAAELGVEVRTGAGRGGRIGRWTPSRWNT